MRRINRPLLGFLCVSLLTVAAYAPGLSGPFVFDDLSNIVSNRYMQPERLGWAELRDAALSSRAGVLRRPLAMVSFALNGYWGDLLPRPFKITNLAIHMLNGLLVFALSSLLVTHLTSNRQRFLSPLGEPDAWLRWLPLAVSTFWLLHPVQLTGVLYVVQRMTSLSATFVLLGMLGFLSSRVLFERRLTAGLAGMFISLGCGTALGLTAKENAVLLPSLAAVVEFTLLSRGNLSHRHKRALTAFYGVVVFIPCCLGLVLLVVMPEVWMEGYAQRDFGPIERLLTQGRVLFFYLSLTVYPKLTSFGIFHDDFILSTGLLTPFTTVICVFAWAAVWALALAARKRHPVALFALGWYFVGHSIESTIIPLELVFEHRNYLPLYGVSFALMWYGGRVLNRWITQPRLAITLAGALALGLASVTAARASIWSSPRSITEFLAAHHPTSARALTAAAFDSISAGESMSAVYKQFQRVVSRDQRALEPVIEMTKMLAGFARIVGASDGPRSELAAIRRAGIAQHQFPRTGAATEVAQELAVREVERRISSFPGSAESSQALLKLQECVRVEVDVCQSLTHLAVRWHLAALENAPAGQFSTARLQLSLAKLYLFTGRSDDAVRMAIAARNSDPGDIGFAVQLVELYAVLEQWDAGERALAALENAVDSSSFRGTEVIRARENFARARSQARSQVQSQSHSQARRGAGRGHATAVGEGR